MRRSLCFVALLLAVPCAHAGPYSDLIVFGDSLSDVGNTATWTLGVAPGTNYYDGRFSNGPVYAERLAEGLGLGELSRDGVGGNDFAYGGAETNGPGGIEGWFLNSLVEQVDDYLDRLNGAVPDSDTLFVVFIGANDFLRGGQTDPSVPAGVVRTQLDRLASAGAETFLGINLPLLGLTPDHSGSDSAEFTALSLDYNMALENVYGDFEASHPDTTLHRLDVATLLSELIADPTPLGFTNTTDAGRDASSGSLDGAPGYVFWDGVHPTRELHALLGEAAIRAVLPEGDYDRDGVLGPDDADTWRAAYGTAFNASLGQTPSLAGDGNGDGRIDAADYTLWRDQSVEPVIGVPEPGSLLLVSVTLLGAQRWRTTASPAAC